MGCVIIYIVAKFQQRALCSSSQLDYQNNSASQLPVQRAEMDQYLSEPNLPMFVDQKRSLRNDP